MRSAVTGMMLAGVLVSASSNAQKNDVLLDMERISVIAISQNPEYVRYEKTIGTSFESILDDNGIRVLDLEKTRELRNNWDKLNDPTSLVTAEDFIERAALYSIDGVVTLYFDLDVREVFNGYYSATAVVSSRIVSSTADVKGEVDKAMGSLGYAPSDGLTKSAAVVNALRRETDRVAQAYQLEVLAPQNPLFLNLQLVQAGLPADAIQIDKEPGLSKAIQQNALIPSNQSGIRRTISCSRLATAGSVGVMGIYIRDMDLQKGPSYGSSLAIVDLEKQTTVNELVFNDVNQSASRRGSAEIEDCIFFNGWRFLFGISNRGLQMFDVEKGRALVNLELPTEIKSPQLSMYNSGGKSFLRVYNRKREFVVELQVER